MQTRRRRTHGACCRGGRPVHIRIFRIRILCYYRGRCLAGAYLFLSVRGQKSLGTESAQNINHSQTRYAGGDFGGNCWVFVKQEY